ncbi:MAG: hypothetical protein KGH69_05430, partial [Candidatus Micrarchaeota archaeon]|nr:hypothetical protein [Candidatus Micrarchaeota archaeon]
MSSYRKGPRPLLYKYEEIKARALFMNNSRTVIVTGFDGNSVEGFVRSDSRKDRYHRTAVELERNRIT